MDYRHFRGETLIKIPQPVRRRLHLLRPIGLAFFVMSFAIPFLTLTGVLESTYLSNLLTWVFLALGPASYIVGMVFDNIIDRAK